MTKYGFLGLAALVLTVGTPLAAQSVSASEPGSGIDPAPILMPGFGPNGAGVQLAQNASPWPAPRTKPPHEQEMERALRSRRNVDPSTSLNEALDHCAKTPACKQQMDAMRGGQLKPLPASRSKPPYEQEMERALRSRRNVDPSTSLNEALDHCAKTPSCKQQMDRMAPAMGRRSMLSRPNILSWLNELNPLRIPSARAAYWKFLYELSAQNHWMIVPDNYHGFAAGVIGGELSTADSSIILRGHVPYETPGFTAKRGYANTSLLLPGGLYFLTINVTCAGVGGTVSAPFYIWTDNGWSNLSTSAFTCSGQTFTVGLPLNLSQGWNRIIWVPNSGSSYSFLMVNALRLYQWL